MARPEKGASPEGTVVICTYDRLALLEGALESLLRQEGLPPGSFEILVVDDGPSPDVRALAEKTGVRYVPAEGRGIASARNIGVRESRGRWLAFFDDDQRAAPGWLAELLRVAREKKAAVVAGSRVLVPPGRGIRLPSHPSLRAYLGEEIWGEEPRPLGPEELPNTGNVWIRRDVFDRVGGFDPAFVESGEDTDLFIRIRREGFSFWAAPAARAEHLVAPEKLSSSWWRSRAFRSGAAVARLRRKSGGRAGLLAGSGRWGVVALAAALRLLPAWAAGRREEVWFRLFLIRHFLGYLRRVPPLLLGGGEGSFLAAPSFREREEAGGGSPW